MKTQHRRAEAFLISEAPGNLSRDNGVLAAGHQYEAGTVLMDDGSDRLVEHDGDDGPAAGILLHWSDSTGGALPVAILARQAEVNLDELDFPTDSDSNISDALSALGIRVRPAVSAGSGGGGDEGDDEMTLISSGAFSSPVANVDVALPTGYSKFVLSFVGLQIDFTTLQNLSCVFSQDNGVTWLNNIDDNDTYMGTVSALTSMAINSGEGSQGFSGLMHIAYIDQVDYVTPIPDDWVGYSGGSTNFDMHINPGDGTVSPGMYCTGRHLTTAQRVAPFVSAWEVVTGTNYKNRVNKIRIATRGTTDLTAPVADGLVRGTWWLRGEATPS